MQSITIQITEASDEGYFYDIYLNKEASEIDEDTESDDGGQCTSEDIAIAIEMATSHAGRLLQDVKDGAI